MWNHMMWISWTLEGSFRSPRLWCIFTNAESCTETSKQATFSCASVEGRRFFKFQLRLFYRFLHFSTDLNVLEFIRFQIFFKYVHLFSLKRVSLCLRCKSGDKAWSWPGWTPRYLPMSEHPGSGASRFAVRSIWCSLKRSQSWETSVWPRTDAQLDTPRNAPSTAPGVQSSADPRCWPSKVMTWSLKHNSSVLNAQSWHNKNRFWFPRNQVQTPHFMAPEVAKQSLGHREGTFCELQNDESIVQSHYSKMDGHVADQACYGDCSIKIYIDLDWKKWMKIHKNSPHTFVFLPCFFVQRWFMRRVWSCCRHLGLRMLDAANDAA
jgi:hypothetical protein